jgi:hypothetical protein
VKHFQLKNYWHNFASKKYTHLLLSLIFIFLFISIVPTNNTLILGLVNFSFMFNLLLVIRTFEISQKSKSLFRFWAFLIVFLSLINPELTDNIWSVGINFFVLICNCLFMLLATIFLTKKLFQEAQVTIDTIQGGICIYFLLGFFWFFLYCLVFLFDKNAFTLISNHPYGEYQLLYFSFTTLTTTGYGDISPINRLAMSLSNLQGIAGQMYPAILIARLVSLYDHQK